MLVDLFLPLPRYVRDLATENGPWTTLAELCIEAQTPCKASGPWIHRAVRLNFRGPPGQARIDPILRHADISLPPGLCERDAARYALCVLAYACMDGAARATVAGMDWARARTPRGRPRRARARSSAERQAAFRARRAQAAQTDAPHGTARP